MKGSGVTYGSRVFRQQEQGVVAGAAVVLAR